MFARPAILGIAVAVGMTGLAAAEDQKDAAQEEALEQAKVSLDDAIAAARNAIPDGKVVDTDVETVDGVVQYAIEIDKDGVKTVFVDLQTGNVLRMLPKEEGKDESDD